RLLGCDAHEATMVGDGVQDRRAGMAAGGRTIGCLSGYGAPAARRAAGADGWWTAFGVAAD
ncbi:MAG: HAD hydrolase-like protein, partial [Planctomycetota bacterium]